MKLSVKKVNCFIAPYFRFGPLVSLKTFYCGKGHTDVPGLVNELVLVKQELFSVRYTFLKIKLITTGTVDLSLFLAFSAAAPVCF